MFCGKYKILFERQTQRGNLMHRKPKCNIFRGFINMLGCISKTKGGHSTIVEILQGRKWQ